MVSRLLGWLARCRVTLIYAAVLTGVTTALVVLGPQVHARIVRHASTNLHNLSHGRIGTLLGSAFVVDAGPIYIWLPGLMCLLAVAELQWGSGRLVVAFVAGHVGATLLVALGLAAAIEMSWLPDSLARATDVGMSYGAAAVIGSLTAAIAPRWRPAWIGWWLAVAVVAIAFGHDFTDIGHAVALMLGMLVSVCFGRAARWTAPTYALLAIAASFGYLVLCNATDTLLVATTSGVLGAAMGEIAARRSKAGSAPAPCLGYRADQKRA